MKKTDKYEVLEKTALELGCEEAKIIPADQIVVEDRVRLRCMIGCPTYGKNLRCPPYTPSVDNFRKILNDYSVAMVMRIKPPEISEILQEKYNPKNSGEDRFWDRYEDPDTAASATWSDFSDIYKSMLMVLLEIERAAFKQGYPLATVFFGGRCMLCEKCNVEEGVCLNPVMSRFASEAMGINLSKTAENAGMQLQFQSEEDPSQLTLMAILLID
jgi:predicted metal-binding protein